MSTTGEFQPGEIHFRIQRLNMNLTVAHLDDQHTIVGKVICGFGKHATYQVQPIVAARQAELRLMMELIWHIREILGVDIRRVRHDQVEALIGQPVETIALHGVDALFETMLLDVAVGHLERIERDVRQHDFCFEKFIRTGDTDAARPGAKIKDALYIITLKMDVLSKYFKIVQVKKCTTT